jgi:hypothetical protein
MAFAFFFFSSEILQKRFLPKKPIYQEGEIKVPAHRNLLIGSFLVYFVIQIALPLRHWTFQDDVLWTEEGHRLSWRMMLRTKTGILRMYVVDKATGKRNSYNYAELLSKKQKRSIKTKPDLIWQLIQNVKEIETEKGNDIEIYLTSRVKVNGGEYYPFIDPEVDMAKAQWHVFKHQDWILPSPADYHELPKKE